MPRQTELTDQLRERICGLLRAGNLVEAAVGACGVAIETHEQWMAKGRRAKSGKHRVYLEEVEDALAAGEALAVTAMAAHVRKDWRAAAWYLERTNPERFGPHVPPPPAEPPSGARRTGLPADWDRRRRLVLNRDPTCTACGKHPSTEVGYRDGDEDHSLKNLRGLCSGCHAPPRARRSGRRAPAE